MFCPNCSKDNSSEQKYCATCGTNLEAVAQTLTGRKEDFFTKMETGIGYFVSRYTEHVFPTTPQAVGGTSRRQVLEAAGASHYYNIC